MPSETCARQNIRERMPGRRDADTVLHVHMDDMRTDRLPSEPRILAAFFPRVMGVPQQSHTVARHRGDEALDPGGVQQQVVRLDHQIDLAGPCPGESTATRPESRCFCQRRIIECAAAIEGAQPAHQRFRPRQEFEQARAVGRAWCRRSQRRVERDRRARRPTKLSPPAPQANRNSPRNKRAGRAFRRARVVRAARRHSAGRERTMLSSGNSLQLRVENVRTYMRCRAIPPARPTAQLFPRDFHRSPAGLRPAPRKRQASSLTGVRRVRPSSTSPPR